MSTGKSEKLQQLIFLCYWSLSYQQCFQVHSGHCSQGTNRKNLLEPCGSQMVSYASLLPALWLLVMALTITTGRTGMFSCEVPGGGSFHSGNWIASFWYGGFFGYGFRGEEGGNLKTKKKISVIAVSGRHRDFNNSPHFLYPWEFI